jgi:hypothetical protein
MDATSALEMAAVTPPARKSLGEEHRNICHVERKEKTGNGAGNSFDSQALGGI